jgi:hypothetical protein
VKLKIYHHHADGKWTYMVAAANIKEACRLMGCTANDIRNYGGWVRTSIYGYPVENEMIPVALSEPGRVWRKLISVTPQPWVYASSTTEAVS